MRSTLRLCANLLVVLVVLLPLFYALSIALMPSSEVFTTDLNLIPK
ncbi:Sugar permease, partial [human gut metagenome]